MACVNHPTSKDMREVRGSIASLRSGGKVRSGKAQSRSEPTATQTRQVIAGKMSAAVGDIGEGVALKAICDRFNLTSDSRYEKPSGSRHGIDEILRDARGQLIVMETKTYRGSRSKTLEELRVQLLPERIENKAREMRDPQNKYYHTEGNAAIGAEILEKGASNIRRVAAYIDSRGHRGQQVMTCEYHEMGSGNRLEHVTTLDVTEIDQPMPEGW